MSLDLKTLQSNAATLRRAIGDLGGLLLPGDYDLQQAAVFTVAQLLRNANAELDKAKNADK